MVDCKYCGKKDLTTTDDRETEFEWEQGKCDLCKTQEVCRECMKTCFDCYKEVCPSCYDICPKCQHFICDECFPSHSESCMKLSAEFEKFEQSIRGNDLPENYKDLIISKIQKEDLVALFKEN